MFNLKWCMYHDNCTQDRKKNTKWVSFPVVVFLVPVMRRYAKWSRTTFCPINVNQVRNQPPEHVIMINIISRLTNDISRTAATVL